MAKTPGDSRAGGWPGGIAGLAGALILLSPFAARASLEDVPGFDVEPIPEWVTPAEIPAHKDIDPAEAEDGQFYLLLNRQTRVHPRESFVHAAYLMVNEQGVQSGSEIRIVINPEYEHLVLHKLNILRDGQTLDRLSKENIRMLRREQDLDAFLIDGRFTCAIHLEDVRVGDVIEYAYTIQGQHPLLADFFMTTFSREWNQSIPRVIDRFLVPKGKEVVSRSFRGAPEPVLTEQDSFVEWLWDRRGTSKLKYELGSPAWFSSGQWVQISHQRAWADVVQWALPLYERSGGDIEGLDDVVEKIKTGNVSPEARTLAALRFVQDHIRYLGTGVGEGTLKPSPSSVVLRRRFGDCKDKTLLFLQILNRLDIPAWPVLVNTLFKNEIREWMPNPGNFDHVIAMVEVNGASYFVDPTRSRQRGGLADVSAIGFGTGLIIRDGETGLATIPVVEQAIPSQDVTHTFTSKGIEEPGTLEIRTVATGGMAEQLRRMWNDNSRDQLKQNLLAYSQKYYDLTPSELALQWSDDEEVNRVELIEHYVVPAPWVLNSNDKKYHLDLSPYELRGSIDVPTLQERQDPFSITGPVRIRQTMKALLHEEWPLIPNRNHRQVEGCEFESEEARHAEGRELSYSFSWKTDSDHITPEAFKDYRKLAADVMDDTAFSLTFNPALARARLPIRVALPQLALVASCFLFAGLLGIKLFFWKFAGPPPIPHPGAPSGIGGWLLLPTLGVLLSPLRMGYDLATVFVWFFNQDHWDAMAALKKPADFAFTQTALLISTTLGVLIFVGSIFLLILWFFRRRLAPHLYIGVLGASAAAIALDLIMTSQPAFQAVLGSQTAPDILPEMTKAAVACGIWIPYMLVSRRVRNTFTR